MRVSCFLQSLVCLAAFTSTSLAFAARPSDVRDNDIVGTLSRQLEPSQSKTSVNWPEASAEERARFAERLPTGARVWVGLIELGQREDLEFPAALVSVHGQPPCLYLDREHKGSFEATARVCFTPLALDYAKWGASTSFHLARGVYRTLPVEFQFPTAKLTDPHTGKVPTLLYNDTFLAKGAIDICGRPRTLAFITSMVTIFTKLHAGPMRGASSTRSM